MNYELINLIKTMKGYLMFICTICKWMNSFCKILEDSLHWIHMQILYDIFVSLSRLELNATGHKNVATWNCLKARHVPIGKIDVLICYQNNTN